MAASLEGLGGSWGRLGAVLERSWGRLGGLLGRLGGQERPKWRGTIFFGPSWGRLGTVSGGSVDSKARGKPNKNSTKITLPFFFRMRFSMIFDTKIMASNDRNLMLL